MSAFAEIADGFIKYLAEARMLNCHYEMRPKGAVVLKLSVAATAVSAAALAGFIIAHNLNSQKESEDLATLRSHRSILTELGAKRKVASQPQGQEVSGAEASLAE